DCIFLISFVFSTNRQADCTVLTVNTGELSFNVIANAQNQSCIFNAVTRSFGSAQVTFNAVSQFYGCAFSVNSSHFTVYDCAFLVQCNPVVERIFCELFNAQRDTLTLCVNLQNNCCDFVAFFVFTNCFFACNVPGDVRQVNQAVDAAVQADEDTEVSDRLDFTFNTVALVVGFRELLPWVVFALLQAQGDTTTFFVDIQNHNFHYVTNVNNFGWVDVFVGPVHFGNVHQAFNAFFDFNEAAVVGQVGNATSQFSTFWVTFS